MNGFWAFWTTLRGFGQLIIAICEGLERGREGIGELLGWVWVARGIASLHLGSHIGGLGRVAKSPRRQSSIQAWRKTKTGTLTGSH